VGCRCDGECPVRIRCEGDTGGRLFGADRELNSVEVVCARGVPFEDNGLESKSCRTGPVKSDDHSDSAGEGTIRDGSTNCNPSVRWTVGGCPGEIDASVGSSFSVSLDMSAIFQY
jgi:hypothetical protein